MEFFWFYLLTSNRFDLDFGASTNACNFQAFVYILTHQQTMIMIFSVFCFQRVFGNLVIVVVVVAE